MNHTIFDPKQLGKNVRYYRKRLRLSQDELADCIGVNVNTISRIESGGSKCSLETLLCLSHSLKVSPDLLLKGNFNPEYSRVENYYHTVSEELLRHIGESLQFKPKEKVKKVPDPLYEYYHSRSAAEPKYQL